MLMAGLSWLAQAESVPEAGTTTEPSAGAESQANLFDVLEFRVEGNTVLPAISIEEAVYPHLGEKKSIGDVELARKALEKAYHDAGYLTVFVDIPEQDVKEGIVRLKVTEGKVERLKVTGARYFSLGRIKAQTPDFAEGSVPYFPAVQKQVAEISRNPDRKVTPVLRPGRSPGKVEVELKVDDQLPLHGSVELNNYYSPNTTHTRMSASLRYDNLWQREHSLAVQFLTTPEKPSETKVLSGTYMMPLAGGDYLAAYAVKSDSDTAALGDVNVIGNGRIVGLRYIHPMGGYAGFYHSLTAGWDYKKFGETVQQLGADSFNTPITYQPFTLGYDATWQGEQRTTQLGVAFNFSVRGWGNSEQEFADKRYNASPDYAYLRLDLKHTEKLPRGFSLYGRVSSQLAGSPLISNEQFSAGGSGSVRGYLESEVLGDVGVQGTIELRTPMLDKDVSALLGQTYALGFIDGAHLVVNDSLPSQQSHYTLTSAGLGLRMKVGKGFNLDLDLARPFRETANTPLELRPRVRMSYAF